VTAVDVNGVTLEYEVHGPDDGVPVLLVMGLGTQLVAWPVSFIERLVAEGHRVVAFDNRDVGRSTHLDGHRPPGLGQLAAALFTGRRADAAYGIEDFADDAAALLDHLGIEQAHVVGASMGGMISQELSIRHPHRVLSLTSIMSNTGARLKGRMSPKLLPTFLKARRSDSRDPADALMVSRLIAGPHFDEDAALQVHELSASREPSATAAADGLARQTLAVLTTRDRTADLGRLLLPVLVIHGLLDLLVRPSGGIATARAIPGARLVMYPDMAHDVPDVRIPEMADEVLANFARASVRVSASA